MSENTFYDLLKRYSHENDDGLKDKSKKPKNPFRKLEEDDVKIIIEKAQNEQERIKTCQSNFEIDMIQDGGSLSESKLDGLKEKMNSAIHGARRIAHEFNMDMLGIGRIIDIGKSRVHEILVFAKIYKQNNILKNKPKHMKRPEKPLQNFSMDFSQKRLRFWRDRANFWSSRYA